jgi:2',3'-cyclic-nucleotide 2'-phosphodiesterase (5'-nucleotidase family)
MAGSIPVTSAASFGRAATDVDMTIDTATRDVVGMTVDNVIVTRDVAQDPAMVELIDRCRAVAAPIANREVGRITSTIDRPPLRPASRPSVTSSPTRGSPPPRPVARG